MTPTAATAGIASRFMLLLLSADRRHPPRRRDHAR
jgi:hypothetical protein